MHGCLPALFFSLMLSRLSLVAASGDMGRGGGRLDRSGSTNSSGPATTRPHSHIRCTPTYRVATAGTIIHMGITYLIACGYNGCFVEKMGKKSKSLNGEVKWW